MAIPSFDVDALFPDAAMFASRKAWSAAGFDVVDRDADKRIMVAGHASVPSCLFKKYPNARETDEQLEKYQIRVNGADALRDFVATYRLSRIVVPENRIVNLGRKRGPILVVERFDLLTTDEAKKAYCRIDKRTLRDLCVVLYAFRGLDSGVRNLPLTPSGQIALIDTERWEETDKRPYIEHVRQYLTRGQILYANTLFKQLRSAEIATRDGEDP